MGILIVGYLPGNDPIPKKGLTERGLTKKREPFEKKWRERRDSNPQPLP